MICIYVCRIINMNVVINKLLTKNISDKYMRKHLYNTINEYLNFDIERIDYTVYQDIPDYKFPGQITLDKQCIYFMDRADSSIRTIDKKTFNVKPFHLQKKVFFLDSICSDTDYIYTTRCLNSQVIIYDKQNRSAKKYKNKYLSNLKCITVDDKYMYAINCNEWDILKFDKKTITFCGIIGKYKKPTSIKTNTNYIYVLEKGPNRISVIDKNNKYKLIGSVNFDTNQIKEFDVDDEYMYILSNYGIFVYSIFGKHVYTYNLLKYGKYHIYIYILADYHSIYILDILGTIHVLKKIYKKPSQNKLLFI